MYAHTDYLYNQHHDVLVCVKMIYVLLLYRNQGMGKMMVNDDQPLDGLGYPAKPQWQHMMRTIEETHGGYNCCHLAICKMK